MTTRDLISSAAEVRELVSEIEKFDRVAIDTEADSLHCYREKLCLLQLSLPSGDHVVDPLASIDPWPLADVLKTREIVLHGADFDLRLLRRSLNFTAGRVFDTVLAARLLGVREFSLAALVQRYFGIELPKGSQKANWARRPLSRQMLEYAINDTHYLLGIAEQMERELQERGRLDWFSQSCQRAIDQSAVERARDPDELWRISGSGSLRGRASAVLRELWHWREKEAEAVDRPPFHILQNEQLLRAAENFHAGETPRYRHLSGRRGDAFVAAAERALQMQESDWPLPRPRIGTRRNGEVMRRIEELRKRRDRVAAELQLEPAFVAPRAALESVATDPSRATALLVSWQRNLLGLNE